MKSLELAELRKALESIPFDAGLPVEHARARMDRFADLYPVPSDIVIESCSLGGVSAESLVVNRAGPAVLYLHGGGYVVGSPKSHRHLAARLAREIEGRVYVLDYRLAPESPFPAALEDAAAAWKALAETDDPRRCAVAGDSAGGGLAFAALVEARESGLPMPGCLVGISPWVNLGSESRSYDRLSRVDPLLSREVIEYYAPRYAGTAARMDGRLSPLFADLTGLPATLLQVGDRECFLGDVVAMHESLISAGVDTELTVWKEMFHVWHLYWPALAEGRAAIEAAARFIGHHCSH